MKARNSIAYLFVILAALCFTMMIVMPRFVSQDVPEILISWFRFLSAALILTPFSVWKRPSKFWVPGKIGVYVPRVILGVCVLLMSVFAINHAPVFIVQTILLANGVFTILLSGVFSEGNLSPINLLPTVAVVVGAAMSSIETTSGATELTVGWNQLLGIGAALAASIGWGIEVLMTRKLAQIDLPFQIVLNVSWLSVLLITPFVVIENWAAINLQSGFFLASMGIFAAVGQLFSARALSIISAAQATPFRYSSVVFGLLIGILVFQEYPTLFQVLGASVVLIVLATLQYRSIRSRLSQKRSSPVGQ